MAIEIYTTGWCPYCRRAKDLLTKKGLAFDEIDVETVPGARAKMMERAKGGRSVPQIFFGDHHIGGCDDLYDLEQSGRLESLVAEFAK